MELIKSIAETNDEVIRSIMNLHNIERFDLDCTYSIGYFWRNLPDPIHKTDLLPKTSDVLEASSDNLPFSDNSMSNIMFDPPFVIAGKSYKNNDDGSSIIAKRFEGFENFNDLKKLYYGTIKESYRILKEKGILVFKCQDTVSSGKNHFTHNMVMNMALSVGFYPKDLIILTAKNRLNSFNGKKWKKQFHARKYHSYFWVFEKSKCRVDYSFDNL